MKSVYSSTKKPRLGFFAGSALVATLLVGSAFGGPKKSTAARQSAAKQSTARVDDVALPKTISDAYASKVIGFYAGNGFISSNMFLRDFVETSSFDPRTKKTTILRYRPLMASQFSAARSRKSKDAALKAASDEFIRDRKLVFHLERALRKFPVYKDEAPLFRGVRGGEFFAGLEPGSLFMDRAFTSTSKDEEVAKAFTHSHNLDPETLKQMEPFQFGPILEIHAIGERGFDISSLNPLEKEVLFDRDTIFKIDSIEKWPAEQGGGVKRVVMTEQSSADTAAYRKNRQRLLNLSNGKILRDSYPQTDADGDKMRFGNPELTELHKADKAMAKLIHAIELSKKPYMKEDLKDSDFDFGD